MDGVPEDMRLLITEQNQKSKSQSTEFLIDFNLILSVCYRPCICLQLLVFHISVELHSLLIVFNLF